MVCVNKSLVRLKILICGLSFEIIISIADENIGCGSPSQSFVLLIGQPNLEGFQQRRAGTLPFFCACCEMSAYDIRLPLATVDYRLEDPKFRPKMERKMMNQMPAVI